MFVTVLHHLKSPENVGMIVRAHTAFGGTRLVVVGPAPWRFKKRARAFSRRLETITDIVHLGDDEALFTWLDEHDRCPVALEIGAGAVSLPDFTFPPRPAVIVGNEGTGIPAHVLRRCRHVVTIPQFGPVGSLNVAVSCAIAMYECTRSRQDRRMIEGATYFVAKEERPEGFEGLLARGARSPVNR